MPVPTSAPAQPDPLASTEAPSCERSSVPPWLRLVVTFGVLLALETLLPRLGLGPTAQVLVLLAALTAFGRLFWWHCGVDRRGVLLMLGVVWAAGLAKIALR